MLKLYSAPHGGTEYVKAEVRAQKTKYRLISDNAPVPFYDKDREWRGREGRRKRGTRPTSRQCG